MTSRTGESESPQAPPREQWSGQLGFLMAAIGSAIGLGNIWRFPGVAYTNGGGAFVVPYVIALLAAGLPILLLDYALGHRFRGSTPAVFRRMSSKLEWLGWFQVFICFVIMTYYAVVVAWSLRYMFFSFTIAWGDDAAGFFQSYIGMDRLGSEVGYSPAVVMGVAVPLLFVWAFGLVVTALGVSDGVERANRIFLPLLVLMFAALVVRALMLPGAGEGLNALFTPKWSALLDYKVWMAALGQIFLSLSVGFGVMLTYASYLQQRRSNLVGTGLVAASPTPPSSCSPASGSSPLSVSWPTLRTPAWTSWRTSRARPCPSSPSPPSSRRCPAVRCSGCFSSPPSPWRG